MSHPRDVRKENITLHEWSPCRHPTTDSDGGQQRRRWKRSDARQPFIGTTSQLWPFSEITAGVVVLNGGKEGHISNTITFDTPQGGQIMRPIGLRHQIYVTDLWFLHRQCRKLVIMHQGPVASVT